MEIQYRRTTTHVIRKVICSSAIVSSFLWQMKSKSEFNFLMHFLKIYHSIISDKNSLKIFDLKISKFKSSQQNHVYKIRKRHSSKVNKSLLDSKDLHLGANLIELSHSSEDLVRIVSLLCKSDVMVPPKYTVYPKRKAKK